MRRGIQKLDVGGDDNGFVPIFGGEAARVDSVVAIIVLKIVLMLQHVPIAQNRAEFLCRLLDDRGVGDHINHAALLIVLGVFKRKGQEESVLPPPVGTVRVNRPRPFSAICRQRFRMLQRIRLRSFCG